VLGPGGNLYSKIVVSAFQAGFTQTQARDLFKDSVYEAFDFMNTSTHQCMI
jgi:hypothetical protein